VWEWDDITRCDTQSNAIFEKAALIQCLGQDDMRSPNQQFVDSYQGLEARNLIAHHLLHLQASPEWHRRLVLPAKEDALSDVLLFGRRLHGIHGLLDVLSEGKFLFVTSVPE
jgi:hypothetical protein